MATSTTRQPKADPLLVDAVDTARSVLVESVGSDAVGEPCGTIVDADRVVTHCFRATQAGYAGWRWAVTLARAPRQRVPTVNEVVLLPGDGALLAPPWLPWKDRVDKGDLGPGDLVPVGDDDPRLVPGYLVGDRMLDGTSAREFSEVVNDVGLGRERVLSVSGRDSAAERWYDGDAGPHTPMAEAAPAHCGTCGFLLRVAGPLAAMFGVCANASSPSDGRAVSLDHGCGAHSDVRAEQAANLGAQGHVHDTITWDAFGDSDVEVIRR